MFHERDSCQSGWLNSLFGAKLHIISNTTVTLVNFLVSSWRGNIKTELL